MRFHFISIRLTKIKKAFTKPSETGYRTTGTLIHPWRECLENSLMIFGKVKDVHILHPPILCLVHTSKKFLSVHIRNVCNNIHSSPWIAKKSGNYWNMHCHGNDLDKDVVYSASGILHSSKKNEIPLYQMVWINHSINWKMQVPEDYNIICRSSKIIILRQRMIKNSRWWSPLGEQTGD